MRMVEWQEWIERYSAASEDDTEYDGAFSHAGEWHAFTLGLGAGMAAALADRPDIAVSVIVTALGLKGAGELDERSGDGVIHEIKREPWYAIGGVIIGFSVIGGMVRLSDAAMHLLNNVIVV